LHWFIIIIIITIID